MGYSWLFSSWQRSLNSSQREEKIIVKWRWISSLVHHKSIRNGRNSSFREKVLLVRSRSAASELQKITSTKLYIKRLTFQKSTYSSPAHLYLKPSICSNFNCGFPIFNLSAFYIKNSMHSVYIRPHEATFRTEIVSHSFTKLY